MAKNFWHRAVNRPITDGDEGKFVVGRGHGGWTCGWILASQGRDGPSIDTGIKHMPYGQFVSTNALRIYTFLESPPQWEEDANPVPDPKAKIVRFRER
jgi:hypothetical protein